MQLKSSRERSFIMVAVNGADRMVLALKRSGDNSGRPVGVQSEIKG